MTKDNDHDRLIILLSDQTCGYKKLCKYSNIGFIFKCWGAREDRNSIFVCNYKKIAKGE